MGRECHDGSHGGYAQLRLRRLLRPNPPRNFISPLPCFKRTIKKSKNISFYIIRFRKYRILLYCSCSGVVYVCLVCLLLIFTHKQVPYLPTGAVRGREVHRVFGFPVLVHITKQPGFNV